MVAWRGACTVVAAVFMPAEARMAPVIARGVSIASAAANIVDVGTEMNPSAVAIAVAALSVKVG